MTAALKNVLVPGEEEGLVLHGATHTYTYNGRRIGGVTEILKSLGLVDDRWFQEHHRQRGNAVHVGMQLLITGQLDWSTVDPRIVGYLRAGENFLRDTGVEIGSPEILTEHLVYSSAYRYGGKVDAYARLFRKMDAVLDWKTGAHDLAHIQTALYEEPLREELGLKRPMRRYAVKLNADGTYHVKEHKDSRDYAHGAAACLLFNHYFLPKIEKETMDHGN